MGRALCRLSPSLEDPIRVRFPGLQPIALKIRSLTLIPNSMKPSPRNLGCRRALEHRLGLIGFASFERTRTHTHTHTHRHTHTHTPTHASTVAHTHTHALQRSRLPSSRVFPNPSLACFRVAKVGCFRSLVCVWVCFCFPAAGEARHEALHGGFRSGRRLAAPQPNDAEAKDGSRRQAAHRS